MGKAENIVENYLSQVCKKRDILCFKFSPMGIRGMPDRILIKDGKVIFVETKSKDGTLSKQQKKRIEQIENEQITVIVAKTKKDIDNVVDTYF